MIEIFESMGTNKRAVRRKLQRHMSNATDEQILAGLEWYHIAGEYAQALSLEFEVPVDTVASVIAALSPQTQWTANKRAARHLLETGQRYPSMMWSNHNRAVRVLYGDSPIEALVEKHGIKGAPKIWNFAHCLLGSEDHLAVDGWASRAAGIKGGLTYSRYEAIADQYRWLGGREGISGPQAQAIVWQSVQGERVKPA